MTFTYQLKTPQPNRDWAFPAPSTGASERGGINRSLSKDDFPLVIMPRIIMPRNYPPECESCPPKSRFPFYRANSKRTRCKRPQSERNRINTARALGVPRDPRSTSIPGHSLMGDSSRSRSTHLQVRRAEQQQGILQGADAACFASFCFGSARCESGLLCV